MKSAAVLLVVVLASSACSGADLRTQWDPTYNPKPTPEQRRATYVASHPHISKTRAADVEAGRMRMGMSSDDLKASWGDPKNISRSVSAMGDYQIWDYCPDYGWNQQFNFCENNGGTQVTLLNGHVASWYTPQGGQ